MHSTFYQQTLICTKKYGKHIPLQGSKIRSELYLWHEIKSILLSQFVDGSLLQYAYVNKHQIQAYLHETLLQLASDIPIVIDLIKLKITKHTPCLHCKTQGIFLNEDLILTQHMYKILYILQLASVLILTLDKKYVDS